MRLRHIEVFDAVYSTGSVTRAAKLLFVSQPSVSKVLAHAEQQLGYALFERVKGRLIPTPEADRLYSHVRNVNRQIDRLRHVSVQLGQAEDSRIRIAATPAFGVRLLPSVIARWRREHSETYFAVETRHYKEINRGLLDSRFDLGLAFEPEDTPKITSETLTHARFMVLAPTNTRFPGKKTLTLADLAPHPFIDLSGQGPLGNSLSREIEESGVLLNRVAEAETYHVARALASEGVGLTITDEITARTVSDLPVNVWPLEPSLTFRVSALHASEAPRSQVTQRFIEFFREALKTFLHQQ